MVIKTFYLILISVAISSNADETVDEFVNVGLAPVQDNSLRVKATLEESFQHTLERYRSALFHILDSMDQPVKTQERILGSELMGDHANCVIALVDRILLKYPPPHTLAGAKDYFAGQLKCIDDRINAFKAIEDKLLHPNNVYGRENEEINNLFKIRQCSAVQGLDHVNGGNLRHAIHGTIIDFNEFAARFQKTLKHPIQGEPKTFNVCYVKDEM